MTLERRHGVHPPMTNLDTVFMDLALELGRRNRGATAENPSVGCVIVSHSDGRPRIVGRAWTEPGGRPHAETVALARAGRLARGATAYVSLEPCCHHGRTPPCCGALIDAGVARVVVAITDPDPRVSGKGCDALRAAGIDVEVGVGAGGARLGLGGFLCRIEKRRPYLTLKLAVSADGKIAAAPGRTTAITGNLARARGHLLRARSDAILVGKNTVLVDDPALTCRLDGLEDRSPVRVVVDSRLELPLACKLVATAHDVPTRIYCTDAAPAEQVEALKAAGVDVVGMGAGADGRPDISLVLKSLGEAGVNDLMVEGGAMLAESLLTADLIDRVALFRSPKPVGAGGIAALGATPLDAITDETGFAHIGNQACGEDMLDWFTRKE